jgi:hypothetical protein
MSLNCGHQRTDCSSPRWYMSKENHSGMISAEENCWLSHHSSPAISPAESSGRNQEEQGRWIWPCEVCLFILTGYFLSCRKILRHRSAGFTSLRKKACCGFLSPLKTIASAVFGPTNLGSNGKHAKNYFTQATKRIILVSCQWKCHFINKQDIIHIHKEN